MDIIIDKSMAGRTIRDILTCDLGFSSKMIKKLKFSENGINVNGKFVTVRYVLCENDVLSLAVEDKPDDVSPYTIPVDIPIEILFEDECVTAVNKPAGVPSHPSRGHRLDTVSNALAYIYRDRNYVFRPVNRLDRDTSGCMLTSNGKAASYKMYLSMTRGEIKKDYIAVVDGRPPLDFAVIDKPLRRTPDSIITREVTSEDDPEGKRAITEYRVLFSDGSHSVVHAKLHTGRTHQIRVHFASCGFPITGDDLYGDKSEFIDRQALHCITTVFKHPQSGEDIKIFAEIPADMRVLIEKVFPNSYEKIMRLASLI